MANLDFWQWLWVVVLGLLVVVGWLWAVAGGCFWLAMVVVGWLWAIVLGWLCWWIGLWCFYCSEIDYFIVVDILFYCDVYIILLC